MKKLYIFVLFILFVNRVFSQFGSQYFYIPGTSTFTVPNGVTSLTVDLVGAGGNGGLDGGGGGGGGGSAYGVYSVVPGNTFTVVVGSAGINPTVGISSFGSFLSATGGANGYTVTNPSVGGGGAGGVGSGGTISNFTGGIGGGGYANYFGGGGGGGAGTCSNGGNGGNCIAFSGNNCTQPGGSGGMSGCMPGGNGGKGASFTFTGSACSGTNPAGNGSIFGAGGGGGNGAGSAPGTGSGGAVEIFWYATTGINELSYNNVSVFPNPFTDKIFVQNMERENYELSNSFGQVIYSGKNIEAQDFSNLPNGIYFLKTQHSISVIKLVKY